MSSVRRLPKSMLLAPEAPGRDAQGLSCRTSRSPACDRGSIKVCFFGAEKGKKNSLCFSAKQNESLEKNFILFEFSFLKKHTFLEKREKRRHRTFSYKKGRPLRHTPRKRRPFMTKTARPPARGELCLMRGYGFGRKVPDGEKPFRPCDGRKTARKQAKYEAAASETRGKTYEKQSKQARLYPGRAHRGDRHHRHSGRRADPHLLRRHREPGWPAIVLWWPTSTRYWRWTTF